MPGVVSQNSTQHHHRSTTKTAQKPFKPRFASKNAIRDKSKGRVESLEKTQRKTPHQQVMSKFDRKNQAKQRRMVRQNDHDKARNVFAGKDGAPRIVAVLPLCDSIDPEEAVNKLNDSLDINAKDLQARGMVPIDRFKQKLQYVPIQRELNTALDTCRVADYVLCLLSAQEEVDEYGEMMLRGIGNQGISNIYTGAAHLDKIEPPKRRPQTLGSLKSFITHFFPDQEKVFSLDSRQECQNVVRSFCTTTPKGINWRQNRSWFYVEEFSSNGKATAGQPSEVVLTGVVRGRNLKADRLVHVGDLGDFQISHINASPRPQPQKGPKEAMSIDSAPVDPQNLDEATEDVDTLDVLAPEDVMTDADMDGTSIAYTERKSVLLDDEVADIAEDEEEEVSAPKRIPKGTSADQAAWYLGDEADYDSDFESDDEAQDEGDVDMDTAPDLVEAGPSMAGDAMDATTTVGDDASLLADEEAGDLAAYRARKHKQTEAESHRQFPDEIELPPSVSARERLIKYRGLKSARTSPWVTEQDKPYEPTEWPRLLDIANPAAVKSRVFNEALVGGVPAGQRVSVHLRNVSSLAIQQLEQQLATPGAAPVAMYSLLRHEHKHTAMHATLTIPRDFPRPIRNKERLVAQVGPRRLVLQAVLSQPGATPNDVHKIQRYAFPGDTVVVSWTGAVMWGAVPIVFFAAKDAPADEDGDEPTAAAVSNDGGDDKALTFLGAGTLLPPSTSRILAKRTILTGQPYALHKRQTHVRYMFFNAADVRYFSALPLWTTRGRRGVIKESLGTHGQFKTVFDGRVNPQEAVGVSLWKRVWPRPAIELNAVAHE